MKLEEKRLDFEERQLEKEALQRKGGKAVSAENYAASDGPRPWTTTTSL